MEIQPTEGNASTVLSIKRKADEAFDALDEALQIRPREIHPSPAKKPNLSFYSSLTKHGIATKSKVKPSVSTPTLSALLSRARSKKDLKSHTNVQSSKMSPATPEYSPGSTEVFLERLSTFNLSTYPSKPQPIDAVAAAMAGWINEGGKNRLFCSICHAGWVVAGREGMSKEGADALVEKQAGCMVNNHKEGCPWRARQCDPLVYRIPLQSPANMARQLREYAETLEPLMESITVRHPLSTSQVSSFMQAVTAVALKPTSTSHPTSENDIETASNSARPTVKTPSSTALLTALFGWTLVSLPAPIIARKPSAVSLAHARNQSLSRASSVVHSTAPSREATPAPTTEFGISSPPSTPFNSQRRPPSSPCTSTPSGSRTGTSTILKRSSVKDATLQCRMCQRRIGLWAFAIPATDSFDSPNGTGAPPLQRQLDLIREHRSYCPYVVKSTPLATLPLYGSIPQPTAPFSLTRADTFTPENHSNSAGGFQKPALFRSATILPQMMSRTLQHGRSGSSSVPSILQNSPLVEGWRVVFNMILRYGISERIGQATDAERSRVSSGQEPSPPVNSTEADEDDAMRGVTRLVDDVKRHGGKQILAYVRNLLG